MILLCIGDVVGSPGRRTLARLLPDLIRRHDIDLVVANGENLAHGAGVTAPTLRELFDAGVDVVTGGNHTWDRREAVALLRDEPRLLRPANYPPSAGGRGHGVFRTRSGRPVGVLNLQGRVFLPETDDPFAIADRLVDELRRETPVILVDLHAEATSEKMAMAWYLDGRASALYGTHTHVPTADARILPGGTAFSSDVGMTGSYDSVIGMRKKEALDRFLTSASKPLEPADGDLRLYALRLDVDEANGRAREIRLLELRHVEGPSSECRILRGAPVAETVERGAGERAARLRERGVVPTLALLSVGEDPASAIYLRRKREAAARTGVETLRRHWGADADPEDVRRTILSLGDDPTVHGVLLQLPLPEGWDADTLQLALAPEKDVDGLHPTNAGRLALGLPGLAPCTPLGVLELLRHYEIPIAGRRVAVLGRSAIVGRPLAALLSQRGIDATVTLAHSRTRDLVDVTREAEILVVAIGRPRAIGAEHVAPGATVIDVGIHRVSDPERPGESRLAGDVDADSVRGTAGALTPVPGGVGPLTVAFLLENVVLAAERAAARGGDAGAGAPTAFARERHGA